MKSISVIILNWNGADMLRQFLPSVVKYSVPFAADDEEFTVDVVVADNGSTDTSLEVLQDFPEVKTIILDQNYGFAEGYNRAIEQITTDYSILLNSDVEVTPDWLVEPIKHMEAHADVAAVQPKILAFATIDEPIHRFEHAGAAGGKYASAAEGVA